MSNWAKRAVMLLMTVDISTSVKECFPDDLPHRGDSAVCVPAGAHVGRVLGVCVCAGLP